MRIILQGFRCYQDQEFTFDDDQFHYIGGCSGIGKSTIFEAIAWCLYGKIQSVTSWDQPTNAPTCVSLEHRGCRITRRRGPSSLEVSEILSEPGPPAPLQGAQAQDKIYKLYGTMDVWLATSYIRQDERHPLFEATPGKRMKMLNQIAFAGDEPELIIEKFTAAIRDGEAKLVHVQSQYQAALAVFNNMTKSGEVSKSYALDQETVDSMIAQMPQFDLNIQQLRQQRDAVQRDLTMRKCYTDIEAQIQQELESLGDQDPDILSKLLSDRQRYDQHMQRQSQIRHRRTALAECEKSLPTVPPPIFTPEYLTQAIAQVRKQTEMRTRAAQVGVAYEAETLEKQIRILELSIDCQWMFPVIKKYNALKQEYDMLEAKVCKTITPQMVEALRNHVQQLERSRDVLECPSCHTGLRYMGTQLDSATESAFDPVAYQAFSQKLDNASKHLAALQRLDVLDQQMKNIEIPYLPPDVQELTSVAGAKSKLEQLRHIIHIGLPEHDPIYIQTCLEWHRLVEQIAGLEAPENPDSPVPAPVNNQLIEEMTLKVARHKLLLQRLQDNQKSLASVGVPIKSVEELDQEIETQIQSQKEIRLAISRSNITVQAMAQYRELARLNAEKARLHQENIDLHDMKRIAIEVQNQTVCDVISSINNYLKNSGGELFDKPINVRVIQTKKVKSSGIEKPEINVSVSYAGSSHGSVKNLSGGEKSRIGLMLTVAMCRAAGSSLLMLDESLSSMDGELKDKALEMLKDSLPGVTILITSHDTPVGRFDRVISL